MKIDVFSHIFPKNYLAAYSQKNEAVLKTGEARSRAVTDIDVRLRLMNRYPEVLQVLTVAQPPLEDFVKPEDAVELARIANDELAELVAKYPDRFIAAAACLPMNNMDAALEEVDRAITELGLKGIQINSRINGEPLDSPKFKPLYDKMARYDLPIWIHPCRNDKMDSFEAGILSRSFETSAAMLRLVAMGIFVEYPDIKFITHHCGGVVPYLKKRIQWLMPDRLGPGHPVRDPMAHLGKFYNDTAVYGNTEALMCGHAFFGTDHILFGTDAPLGTRFGLTGETRASVERMGIPDIDKEKIFLQNAVNLLKLPV